MSKNEQQGDAQKRYESSAENQKNKTTQQNRLLKDRFLEAVASGELGCVESSGTVVTLKAFKAYFSDIKTDYINSFLPAATLQPGQLTRGIYFGSGKAFIWCTLRCCGFIGSSLNKLVGYAF